MPDIVSTRPSSGQPIATAWGDEVHDQLEGMQAGSVNVTRPAGAVTVSGTAAVVFPKPYLAPPIVVANMAGTNTNVIVGGAANVTATGFTAWINRIDGVTTGTTQAVAWLAIGTLA